MTTTQKWAWGTIAIAVLVSAVIWFGFLTRASDGFNAALPASSAGTTLNSAKLAEQIVTTSSSTIFSITNNDASDRIISSADAFLSGGTSTSTSYVIACATSSNTGTAGANKILQLTIAPTDSLTFGTTTTGFYMASSSPGITSTSTPQGGTSPQARNPFARVWASGSTLVCNLTTTGGGGNLFDSGISGYVAFPYKGE